MSLAVRQVHYFLSSSPNITTPSSSSAPAQESAPDSVSLLNQAAELCGRNQTSEATAVAATIQNPTEKINAQKAIVDRLVSLGKFPEALDVACLLPGNDRSFMLIYIFRLMGKYDLAVHVAVTMPSKLRASKELLEIVRDYVQLGHLDEGLEVARQMPSKDIQVFAFNLISWKYTTLRKFDKALQVADEIQVPIQKANARIRVHCKACHFQTAWDEANQNTFGDEFRDFLLQVIRDIIDNGREWVGHSVSWSPYRANLPVKP